MSDSISEEDRRDYINEVKQGEYDSKVESHIQAMSLEDIAGIIRFNSDHLGEMFDHHISPCEDPTEWINKHAELLADLWMKRRTIIGLLEQQMNNDLTNIGVLEKQIGHEVTNEAEQAIDDSGWQG